MIHTRLSQTLPLFVFGTLRSGRENHHFLLGQFERMLPANLAGYARIEPLMIAPRPAGLVDGELYFLRVDEYDATLAGCDRLEGIPPGTLSGREYERKRVVVATSAGLYDAWAYVQTES
ncbi:MAG: gamma-glutamylcyclotransferase [Planctomycetales bacterium]|jgi:gamma-glutamylcyclotransferase (GGCT)/AIG2-like uncharacterized protein YtfP|nr:gamma-glutamylcyclotransferase [Planctomycetales bacterium]